jgi:hypothetical protein
MANDRSGGKGREGLDHANDFQKLESWIASAWDYVVRTYDLRPRVLEAAAMVSDNKPQERRIDYAIISAVIVSACWSLACYWLVTDHSKFELCDFTSTTWSVLHSINNCNRTI